MNKLPPHLQELVEKINKQNATFTVTEMSCDEIFAMNDAKKKEVKDNESPKRG